MSEKYFRSTRPIEGQLREVMDENAHLKAAVHNLKLELGLREKELAEAKTKADHFTILMTAVKENEVVRGAWDKFMMTLRLAGYDGTK